MFFWKNIIYKSIFEFFSTFYEGEIIRLYFAEQREFRESIEKYMNDQEQQVNEEQFISTLYENLINIVVLQLYRRHA